jgi:2,4-dienoyl-CoA reductase-like NADH-dependent reductase (Old Yellow Enzyme family)
MSDTIKVSTAITLPCGAILPNRLCKAAMTEGLADPWGRATERHVTLYRRWAKSGAGLLLSGNIQIDRCFPAIFKLTAAHWSGLGTFALKVRKTLSKCLA